MADLLTLGLVDIVIRERDLVLREHMPGPIKQLDRDLWVHGGIDHRLNIGLAVKLSCKFGRESCRHDEDGEG